MAHVPALPQAYRCPIEIFGDLRKGKTVTETQRIRKALCQSAGNLNSLALRVAAARPVRV
jgi:hypothetical protein